MPAGATAVSRQRRRRAGALLIYWRALIGSTDSRLAICSMRKAWARIPISIEPNPRSLPKARGMRIKCQFCGERDLSEFSYLGEANCARPDPDAADAQERFFTEVYLRDNPAGPIEELWFHSSGCRAWLKVRRNTRTHEILG